MLKVAVEFKEVYFSYDGKEDILKGLSFKTMPGEWIPVVGHSGVGKTTLLSLILSFYKRNEGDNLFDGLSASNYQLKSLHPRIGYVSQNPTLLSGTTIENLRYCNGNADEKSIVRAAKSAGIHIFIQDLSDKYDEKLGEHGVNLSEGQRQRLSLARTLVINPDIIILDDPTFPLDHKTNSSIFKQLPRIIRNKTFIIVSHRLSTIKSANQILLLIGEN